ncbi:hypothetical protein, partial [Frankia sp. Cas4]|uniref:hypothetical protein n=1 Tax=Frankia sp. Cas4 TaxID=3073927 RepID=UPI002AD2B291
GQRVRDDCQIARPEAAGSGTDRLALTGCRWLASCRLCGSLPAWCAAGLVPPAGHVPPPDS